MSFVTVAVRRVKPLLTVKEFVSGLWFHSQAGLRDGPENVSVRPQFFVTPDVPGKVGYVLVLRCLSTVRLL